MPRNYGSVSNTNWLPSNGKRFSYPDGTMKIGWLQNCHQYPNGEVYYGSSGVVPYHEKTDCCNGCGQPNSDDHKNFETDCVLLQPNLPVARETPKSEDREGNVVVRLNSCIAMCRAHFYLCPTCTKRAEMVMRTSDHLAIGSSWMELVTEVSQILTDTEWDNPNAAKWSWEINTQYWTNKIGTKPHVYDGPEPDY